MTVSQDRSSISMAGEKKFVRALLTRMSSPPSAEMVVSTMPCS